MTERSEVSATGINSSIYRFINLSIPWREWSEAEFSATGIIFSPLIPQMQLNIFVVDVYNDPSFMVF